MMKTAYFAGGCFWCITPCFARLPGVDSVVSGYSGGEEKDPTYAQVKHQETHHRETVAVTYDPAQVSYETLLSIFLRHVDPFDGGGQFIDRGTSYTLAVYYTDAAEKAAAEARFAALAARAGKPVQITLAPFAAFYEAEEEHQDYYLKHHQEFAEEMRASGRLKEESHEL